MKTRRIEKKEHTIHIFAVCFLIAFRLVELMLPGRRPCAQKWRLRRAFEQPARPRLPAAKNKKVKLHSTKQNKQIRKID